jgi:hypothetical protein
MPTNMALVLPYHADKHALCSTTPMDLTALYLHKKKLNINIKKIIQPYQHTQKSRHQIIISAHQTNPRFLNSLLIFP